MSSNLSRKPNDSSIRGDVFLIKSTGDLDMSHKYTDTPQAMVDLTANVVKKLYESESLVTRLEWNKGCERGFEKHSALLFNNCLV